MGPSLSSSSSSSSSSQSTNITGSSSITFLSIWSAVAATALTSSAITYYTYWYYDRRVRKGDDPDSGDKVVIQSWKQKRDEERTGRIRAEVKLRDALTKLKKYEAAAVNAASQEDEAKSSSSHHDGNDENFMVLQTVGEIISPFPKRMGTPRQGSLVPSVRGCVQLHSKVDPTLLDGIEEYSHIWIIFAFHQNTNLTTSQKTKIRPPRAPHKVGQLSTRSPHRPNPLGLSLVKIRRWEPSKRLLHISALDLVDGTPVYDIKPWVPWDIPDIGYTGIEKVGIDVVDRVGQVGGEGRTDSGNDTTKDDSRMLLRPSWVVPSWVDSQDDVLASVEWTTEATDAITKLTTKNKIHPLLYPSKDVSSLADAVSTIEQILAQDPRSSHRGQIKNKRGTVSSTPSSSSLSSSSSSHKDNGGNTDVDDDDGLYRLRFGETIVEFVVETGGAIVKNIVEAPTTTTSA